jgi:hypothetical protein
VRSYSDKDARLDSVFSFKTVRLTYALLLDFDHHLEFSGETFSAFCKIRDRDYRLHMQSLLVVNGPMSNAVRSQEVKSSLLLSLEHNRKLPDSQLPFISKTSFVKAWWAWLDACSTESDKWFECPISKDIPDDQLELTFDGVSVGIKRDLLEVKNLPGCAEEKTRSVAPRLVTYWYSS